ncbi:endo-1,4-beta-xylanase [Nonomuraea mesophila]|nr:endo-1,4-beta-xylanase [Nonomuraea mesophila]
MGQRFADLGVDVRITELDVASGSNADATASQPSEHKMAMAA